MARQAPVKERPVRISLHGTGRDHWHVVLSKSRGLDRVLAVATFETRLEACDRADKVYAQYRDMGFTGRTTWAGTVLELVKAGETTSYLMTRHCCLRHNITG